MQDIRRIASEYERVLSFVAAELASTSHHLTFHGRKMLSHVGNFAFFRYVAHLQMVS